jgi:hypothetical protein
MEEDEFDLFGGEFEIEATTIYDDITTKSEEPKIVFPISLMKTPSNKDFIENISKARKLSLLLEYIIINNENYEVDIIQDDWYSEPTEVWKTTIKIYPTIKEKLNNLADRNSVTPTKMLRILFNHTFETKYKKEVK